MPIINYEYTEGTIKNPQHTESSESCFIDTDKVHFPDGRLTPIPAFVVSSGAAGSVELKGNCRSIWGATLSTPSYSGQHYLFGTHTGLYDEFRGVRYNVTPLVGTATATLGADPLSTVISTATITVNYVGHDLSVGDRIKLDGATDIGGISAESYINIEHIVTTVVDVDNFTIEIGDTATSTATGGGASVDIFKQIASGNEYQEFLSGYGAGLYGRGTYGTNRFSTSTFSFPRIWSFDNFGDSIICCPGDYDVRDGQKIYIWDGNNNIAPTILTNAPTNCNWVLVVDNSVIALCGTDIRISERGDATVWTGVTTNIFPVERTNRLLSGFKLDDKSAIIFAPTPYLLRFVGGEWDLTELGDEYSIVSPQAAARLNDGLLWYGQTGHFYYFDGSNVQTIINRQNGEFVKRRLDINNIWVTHMLQDPRHNQVWLYYPSMGSQDPNEYVICNPRTYRGGAPFSFTLGTQTRTAAQRPTLVNDRFYMADCEEVYASFTTQSVSFAWSAQTAQFFVDGEHRYKINNIKADSYQTGNVSFELLGVDEPNTEEISYGSYTIEPTSGTVTTDGAGKLFSFVFSGSNDMTLGGLRLDVNRQGRRFR